MDVSHELGALRFVVDSPLSSKVAMFNQQVNQHKQSQLLNPFSAADGRASPKPTFSKDEYGKPLAGSLTEMRGQKANIHVLKEMLELCQVIDAEGYDVKDEPSMRVIPFGELFNIYNYISDKVVGILLRARKHKLVEFEGEMLFQRRDDDVPIFLLKPVHEIRREMEEKIESIKRCGSPAPQATSVLLDKKTHGLKVAKGATPRSSVSRTPSPPALKKAETPIRDIEAKTATEVEVLEATKIQNNQEGTAGAIKTEVKETKSTEEVLKPKEALVQTAAQPEETKEQIKSQEVEDVTSGQQPPIVEVQTNAVETPTAAAETKTDVNNNANNDLPTIVIQTNAVYESPAEADKTAETENSAAITNTITTTNIAPAATESNTVESNAPVEPSETA